MLERVFRGAVHLELEDVDRAPLPDDGIAPALPVLDFAEDELAHQFEDEPHERLAVKLVSLLARLFRSGGENGVHPLHELIDFSGTEGFEEIHYLDFLVVVVEPCIQRKKPFVEAEFHLVVRQAYRVAVEFLLVILDCEVAGLVEHRNRLARIQPVLLKRAGVHVDSVFERRIVEDSFPHHLREEGGRACREPVASEIAVRESVQKAERIVDVGPRVLGEMVAVVVFFELFEALFFCNLVLLRHVLDFGNKIRLKLLLRDSTNRGESLRHGNVPKVVQVGEDAYLVEPSDSRDEDEADVRVLAFYDPVERFEDFSERIHETLVADRVQKRLVVLVHENRRLQSSLLVRAFQQVAEPVGRTCGIFVSDAVNFFIFVKLQPKRPSEILLVRKIADVDIKIENRLLLPFLFCL